MDLIKTVFLPHHIKKNHTLKLPFNDLNFKIVIGDVLDYELHVNSKM